jgi:hypothetical protein
MRAPRMPGRSLAILMGAQAALGLILPAQYRDPEPIRTTWFGNDWITLFVAVPLLLGSHARAAHGSPRARLLWLGAIAYAVYNYAFYLFGAALNVFLPLYVLAVVVSAATLILALSGLDADAVARDFHPDTPVRSIGGLLAAIGSGLAAVWIAMWAAYVFGGRPTPIDPEAFKIVAALDLALMVPVLTTSGVLLWRRRPWGYIMASLASIQGALYLLVLSVNSVVAIRRGLASKPGELPVWGPLALLTAAIALVLLRNVRQERVARP